MDTEKYYQNICLGLTKLVAHTRKQTVLAFGFATIALVLHGCATIEGINQDFNSAVSQITSDRKSTPVTVPSNHEDLVRGIQIMLTEQGYSLGAADGKGGPATRKALKQFQGDNDHKVTDGIDSEAYRQLATISQSKSGVSASVDKTMTSKPECERNFKRTNDGLINYQTHASLGTVSVSSAIDRIARQLMKDGYNIQQRDPADGFVSAVFDPGGLNNQFSSFIKKSGGQTRAELTLALTGGSFFHLLMPAAPYRSDLCTYVEVMKGNR